jgi:hypothetical protein
VLEWLYDEDGFQKQRAQSGEAMAGGAADWIKGGPVTVGDKGEERCVFGTWIYQMLKRDVFLPFPIRHHLSCRELR